MKRTSRTGRMLEVVLAATLMLIAPLRAEESVIRIQDPKPQQSQDRDIKKLELADQGPKLQDPKVKEPKHEETGIKPTKSLILTVKLALMADQRVAPYDIEVETKGQEVLLTGKVPSEAEKLASAEVARRVEGVQSVVNKLEVVKELQPALMRKQDQLVTECVKEVFKKSATLKVADFAVKTENGVVELSGTTRFQVIVLEAAEAARQVPGVRAVKSDAVRIESTK